MACVLRSARVMMARNVSVRQSSDWAARATGKTPEKQMPTDDDVGSAENPPAAEDMFMLNITEDGTPEGMNEPGVNHPSDAVSKGGEDVDDITKPPTTKQQE